MYIYVKFVETLETDGRIFSRIAVYYSHDLKNKTDIKQPVGTCCLLTVNYACSPQHWACPDNGKCIPISQVCDDTVNCDSGQDEGLTCGTYQFPSAPNTNSP